jgi:hypothetical protein
VTQMSRVRRLVDDVSGEELARHILEFNPKAPAERVFTSAMITKALGVPGTLDLESASADSGTASTGRPGPAATTKSETPTATGPEITTSAESVLAQAIPVLA